MEGGLTLADCNGHTAAVGDSTLNDALQNQPSGQAAMMDHNRRLLNLLFEPGTKLSKNELSAHSP